MATNSETDLDMLRGQIREALRIAQRQQVTWAYLCRGMLDGQAEVSPAQWEQLEGSAIKGICAFNALEDDFDQLDALYGKAAADWASNKALELVGINYPPPPADNPEDAAANPASGAV